MKTTTLEEIDNLWAADSELDWDVLSKQTLQTSQLQSKYYKLFEREKLIREELFAYYDQMKLLRYLFYTGKLSKEQLEENDWMDEHKELGRAVRKNELDMYMNADKYIRPVAKDINLCELKMAKLEKILDDIKWRPSQIKTALAVRQFSEGQA